jgi:cyclopropane fatty-acyl-phospholipid synthase-like methyltransferase
VTVDVTQSTDTTEHRSDYWDEYYAARTTTRRPLPSQFATFVAGELERPHRVVELGCGGGRDSIFFASNGHDVIGVDGSKAAVASCRDLAQALGVPAIFVHSTIDAPDLAERLRGGADPLAIYARFFIHAITDEEEEVFLDLASQLARSGDIVAVEYRTVRDQVGAKETGAHYRRFVLPATFQARALQRGFEVVYAVEGFGFAKYRHDDAYVARTLFRKA